MNIAGKLEIVGCVGALYLVTFILGYRMMESLGPIPLFVYVAFYIAAVYVGIIAQKRDEGLPKLFSRSVIFCFLTIVAFLISSKLAIILVGLATVCVTSAAILTNLVASVRESEKAT